MKQYLLIIGFSVLAGATVYGLTNEQDPYILIERQNRSDILECTNKLDSFTGSSQQLQKELEKCAKIQLKIIGTGTLAPKSEPPSIETAKLNDCMSKYNHKKVCTEYAQGLRTDNIKFEIETEELGTLHDKICKQQINSPLCKDRALFDRLYQITEERLPGKNFYPILLGITNAESSLGLNFAKDRVGGTCAGRNNWGGIKWKKTDDGESIKDQGIPDQYGCYLYNFDSIEDYWISKVNTVRFGYKGCVDSPTPIRCISFAYVGDRNVAEESWIRNVSIFLD